MALAEKKGNGFHSQTGTDAGFSSCGSEMTKYTTAGMVGSWKFLLWARPTFMS